MAITKSNKRSIIAIVPPKCNLKCTYYGFPQILSWMSTKLGEGEEREEMLLKLSRSTLELNLSLEWSIDPWEWERRRGELFFFQEDVSKCENGELMEEEERGDPALSPASQPPDHCCVGAPFPHWNSQAGAPLPTVGMGGSPHWKFQLNFLLSGAKQQSTLAEQFNRVELEFLVQTSQHAHFKCYLFPKASN